MKAVNLLPSDLRGAPKGSAASSPGTDVPRGPGAFIVLGALAISVLALAAYVLTTNSIKERQAASVQLTVRQQAAETRAGALRPYAEFQQLANSRVATLKDLAGQRFDWDQTLRDLSRALPRNVTIKSLDGSLSGSDSTGASSSTAASTGPSITLSGCTATQSSVARLMARLHDVNGVTSVSLASSAKAETATSTAVSESPSAGNGAPCGPGRHPDFKVVIHFEHSAAAAASAGAAATSGTPATAAQPATATPAGGAQTSSASITHGGVK
jgi:Tfp pilus assembly protein PilN